MLSDKYIEEYYNNNKSGKMSSVKYVSKHYHDDYILILEYCNNELVDIPFKEKVYNTINNIQSITRCMNPNCDNKVKFKNSTIGYLNYCSNKCIGSDPNIQERKENTNLEKFGHKHASLNEDIKLKTKIIISNRTEIEKKSINNKRIETVNDRYGVDNVNKIPEIKEKRVSSFKENIETWKENYRNTSIEKYGVEHPWMNEDIHKKTVISSLGNRMSIYEDKVRSKLPEGYSLIGIISNGGSRLSSTIKCPNCKDIFTINNNLIYDRTVRNKTELCIKCNPISNGTSGMEIQLLNFISNTYMGEIISNDRKIISPLELDIYLPELNIAFEFNGLYWHSELNKEKNYHYNKTKVCEERGINLIHIWEDDWILKNDIIKSMIRNKLSMNVNRIYARKCEVKIIDNNKLIRDFLNDNHIQGFVGSSIKIGLYYNNELVSIMTFGKLRQSMGNIPDTNRYELMRFCNKLNTSVVGGASKLLKYFIKNYEYVNIISYSDNSYSDGKLYETIGFELEDSGEKLNYYWVLDKKRYHRYNFRKDKLVKEGYDPLKSEREIMYEDVGSYRIWSCGNKKWIYHR